MHNCLPLSVDLVIKRHIMSSAGLQCFSRHRGWSKSSWVLRVTPWEMDALPAEPALFLIDCAASDAIELVLNRPSECSEEYCEPWTAGCVVSDLGSQCSFISQLWWRVFALCFYCCLCGTLSLFWFLLHDKLQSGWASSFRSLTQTKPIHFYIFFLVK